VPRRVCDVFLRSAGPRGKMDHRYEVRVGRELVQCRLNHPSVVRRVKTRHGNLFKWKVTLVNGVVLSLTFGKSFPFEAPRISFLNFSDPHGLIACECEAPWGCGVRVPTYLTAVYAHTETILYPKRLMGILRCAPMLMLWRKRATERLFHPSRIDFVGELRELQALLPVR